MDWYHHDRMKGPDLHGCTLAVDFMRKETLNSVPLNILQLHVSPPILTCQAQYALNEEQDIESLITWAHVSDDLHSQFLVGKRRMLDATEWNEGLNTWIIHSFAPTKTRYWQLVHIVKLLAISYGCIFFSCTSRDPSTISVLRFCNGRFSIGS